MNHISEIMFGADRMQQFNFEGIALRGETTNGKNESRASTEGRSGL
jgi:hypothetical protein